MAKFIMIMVLGGMITNGITSFSQNNNVNQDTQNYLDDFTYNHANDIASSVADILLTRLSEDPTYEDKAQATDDFFGGTATYIVEETFLEDDNLIEIKVTSKSNGVTTIITTDINRETKRKERINVRYEYE